MIQQIKQKVVAMYKRYLPLILFAVACGTPSEPELTRRVAWTYAAEGVAPALVDWDTAFRVDMQARGIYDLPVLSTFQVDAAQVRRVCKEDSIGCCATEGGGIPFEVRRHVWIAVLPAVEQQWVIYHELGHCLLDLDHTPPSDEADAPVTMMDAKSPGFNYLSRLGHVGADRVSETNPWERLVDGLARAYYVKREQTKGH